MNLDYLLPPLVAAGFGTALLVIVLLRGRQQGVVFRIFSLFLCSTIGWALVIFAMRASPDVEHALRWDRAVVPVGIAVSLFYYHLSLVLTSIGKQRILLRAGYLLLVVVAALSPSSLFIERMEVQYYGYAPIIGPSLIPLLAFSYFLSIMALYNLIRGYRSVPVPEKKNRLLYITIGMVITLIAGIFEVFPTIYPTAIFGNIVFGFLASVAILKYHLLDIHVVIRKGTAYFLMSAVVAIPYAGIIFLFARVFQTQVIPLWVYLILLVVLALLLQPLWARVQHLVDRWFYRERYDYLRALERFSQETQSIVNLEKLGSNMVQLVSGASRTSSACLLLSSESKHGLVVVSSTGLESPPPKIVLRIESPLVKWLELHGDILSSEQLDIFPQLQGLSIREKQNLERMQAKLYVPIKTRQGHLSGILVLGEKLSQQSYSGEDEQLLATVSHQMAMALENARLYDSEKTMRKELEKQDQRKTEFLHSVAHEFKTPLTAIISSSELLSTEPSSATVSQRQRLIQNITQSAQSMDGRVTQLLDFAKMQVEDLKINPQLLEIGSAIEEIASRLLVLFQNKQQSLELEIPDSLPQVKADRGKLEQILLNLLSNANKFSPTGGNITLRVREDGNRIVVEVKDSAPAIPKGEKVRLFDYYYRSEDADKRQHFPGLGLGLAISRKLVELHQGEIWVDSKPRKGNTFAFSLPTLEQRAKGIG